MVRFIILQLTAFQKENLKMRCDLEREITARQTLQLQLESKEQLVGSLKSQLEARSASGLLTATDNSSLLASGASRLSTHELVSPRAVSAHGTRGCLCTRHARPSVYTTRAAVCVHDTRGRLRDTRCLCIPPCRICYGCSQCWCFTRASVFSSERRKRRATSRRRTRATGSLKSARYSILADVYSDWCMRACSDSCEVALYVTISCTINHLCNVCHNFNGSLMH